MRRVNVNRNVWKWMLGISIAGLFLLILFTIGVWAVANAAGALFAVLLMPNENVHIQQGIPFGDFMANFVGSPLFYIYLVDVAVLLGSIIALIVTRKRR